MAKPKEKQQAAADTPQQPEPKQIPAAEESNANVAPPIDFQADAGMGQAFTGSDLAIPFLVILQKNSPQVDPDSGKYVEGAKPTMIFNTVTGELFDGKTTGISVVMSGYQKKYVEWIHRDDGGGFVAQHDPESDAVRACKLNEKDKLVTKDGHQMVETAYHYVVLTGAGMPQWAVISMSSSQLKKSRKWNTLVAGLTMTKNGQSFKPPIFAGVYQLKTVLEQKDTNNWYGWDITPTGLVTDRGVYDCAKSYHQALTAGMVNVTRPPSNETAENEPPDTSNAPF